MKIFAVYVIISVIEWILVYFQIKALILKEERENGIQFKSESTSLERCLSIVKSFIIMAIPILRSIVTFIVLFSSEAQDTMIEQLYEKYQTVSKE